MTTIAYGSKIKIIKDHFNGKTLSRPKYGYVVAVVDCKDGPDGYMITEQGNQNQGKAYLVQTSWGGGATWYSRFAIMPVAGIHRLGEWKKQLENYNNKHS
jgi:hypothetical protein